MKGWNSVPKKAVYASAPHPTYSMVSSIARIQKSKGNSIPFTIIPSDLLGKNLLPVSETIHSAGPEVLVPGEVTS